MNVPRFAFLSLVIVLGACSSGTSVVSRDVPETLDARRDLDAPQLPELPPTDTVTELSPSCPPELGRCGDLCVDLRADRAHCGDCATRCPLGQACSAGVCSLECAPPLVACGEPSARRCVDPQLDPGHCGGCARRCAAGESCASGACALLCPPGQSRCGESCRDLMRDSGHCGACGATCPPGQACRAGACALNCPAGQAACGGACRDTSSDASHCGGCSMACGSAANALVTCAAGRCERVCASGFADCDGDAANGCEADTRASASHCARCGNACVTSHGTPRCVDGACEVLRCDEGFGDCDGEPVNGCEVETRRSASHCGGCGRACNLGNATASCVAGACAVASCAAGFADCDGAPGNGCETQLSSASAHCGACGRSCVSGEVCASGVCTLSCPEGQTACGRGCFELASTSLHCGACSTACGAVSSAVSRCEAGRCAFTCLAGFADCDGDAGTGCEVDLRTSGSHCGSCRSACAADHGTSVCEASRCSVSSCDPGFGDCNALAADGCEVDTRSSVGQCGACGRPCLVANGTPSCVSGGCSVAACNAGFGDCDASVINGCETDLRASARSCGACGRGCDVGARCVAGACVLPRNAADIRAADPSARSGAYALDPDGNGPMSPLRLYVDFDSDGGAWVLVWKSNMANNNDRTDTGYNTGALASGAVDDVAVAPREFTNALGSTFRVVSGDGSRRFFWQGVGFYTTDDHRGRAAGSTQAVLTTVDIARGFRSGEATFYPTHALCVFDGLANVTPGHTFAEHFCGGRWCCGSNAGAWWNYGRWSPGGYTSATAWAR